ncbi:DUF3169 family protein [Staphylococcus simulans]|uniref:DUF3169 family protein n=1 Tax=Staphylococcus simulans TaxID=1286 RepID=UPI00131A2BB6|nr:DUF3169 family protein [Staphylococcus simulans]
MNKKKNHFIYGLKLLIGALIGFFGVYFFEYLSGQSQIQLFDFRRTMVATIITLIIVLLIGGWMVNQLHQAKKYKLLSEEDEIHADDYDNRFNQYLFTASILIYICVFIVLANMILATVLKDGDNFWEMTVIPFIVYVIFNLIYQIYIPKLDQKLPKFNDSRYVDKLIGAMDEGEKHVTYSALFKLFHFNLSALIIIIVVLVFYSAITENPQTLALAIVFVLFVYNVSYYYSKIHKYYKSK